MTELPQADNVISMFSRKNETAAVTSSDLKTDKSEDTEISSEEIFQAAMKKNADIQKRLRDSRIKSNKSVLRSYRIKK